MSALSIGLSALQVNQRLLDLTGQNIANANTPGYHRQVGELAARVGGTEVGAGVDIKYISRSVNTLFETAAQTNSTAAAKTSTQLDGLNQLQSFLAPGAGSLTDLVSKFFDDASKLTTQPSDLAQRRVVLSTANSLTNRLNETQTAFNSLRGGLLVQAKAQVEAVNGLAKTIAQLDQQIHDASVQAGPVNDLLDARSTAISKLAALVDIRAVPQAFNQVNIFAGGVPLVLNSTVTPLAVQDQQGQIAVTTLDSTSPVAITGGSIGGTLSLANTILPGIQSQLDAFTHSFIQQLDAIHASGVGLGGAMTTLASQRPIFQTNAPLASLNLAFPPKAGDLYVTVTNLATGQRTLNKVSIDPATQSLSAVASSLSAVPNLNATVDPQSGTLNIAARPGYAFDFTGNVSTKPDTQTITGTTTASLGGAYAGPANDTLTFRFLNAGTIGSTANLTLEARNAAGSVVASLNVGKGYEAGANLAAVFGVNVKLTTGTVNAGDAFTVQVAANPDGAGLLPALGLNSMFVGTNAGTVKVRPDLLDHPEQFALSRTGQPGDGGQLNAIVALRDQTVVNGNQQTLEQYLSGILGDVGAQVSDTDSRKSAYAALGQQLDQQVQAATGVDPNEELVKLVQYQHAFQMSAKYVSTVNQTLDALFQIL